VNAGLIRAWELIMTEPLIAQKSPYAVELIAGKDYFWCRCGRSATQPFCDATHKGSGISPLRFTATKTETVWLCGCKHTQSPPRCDGSHKRL
jgi:CDGSH-type Zn-finger protein